MDCFIAYVIICFTALALLYVFARYVDYRFNIKETKIEHMYIRKDMKYQLKQTKMMNIDTIREINKNLYDSIEDDED